MKKRILELLMVNSNWSDSWRYRYNKKTLLDDNVSKMLNKRIN